jgi:hypothetical protein
MKTYAREAVIGALLIIIYWLIYIIIENGTKLSEVFALDFKTVFSSFATFGGAALGAMLAGKYTLRSIKEQKRFEDERDIETTEIQTIKFYDTFYRTFTEIDFYFDIFQGFHGGDFDNDDIEEKIRVDVTKLEDDLKDKIAEIRKFSLSLDLEREFQMLLIDVLNKRYILGYYLRGWDPRKDARSKETFENFIVDRIKSNESFFALQDSVSKLKNKYNL